LSFNLNSATRGSKLRRIAHEIIEYLLDLADIRDKKRQIRLDNQLDDAMHSLEVEAELAARMERLGI